MHIRVCMCVCAHTDIHTQTPLKIIIETRKKKDSSWDYCAKLCRLPLDLLYDPHTTPGPGPVLSAESADSVPYFCLLVTTAARLFQTILLLLKL